MAIKRPAIYEHNNPNLPIVDSDFVRGGFRSAVQTLNDLYALTGKAGQLKQHSTQIYVSGESKIYFLKDANNIGNSSGWEQVNVGNVSVDTNVVRITGDQTISGVKSFENPLVFSDNVLFSSPIGTFTQFGSSFFIDDGGLFLGRTKLNQKSSRLERVGVDWSDNFTSLSRFWTSIAVSCNGQYQTAVAAGSEGDTIWISKDYGATWTQTESPRKWTSVAMSSDGRYQTAVEGGQISFLSPGGSNSVVSDSGGIYTSNNYGLTWTRRESSQDRIWMHVAVSSDGKYQTAVVYTGSVYNSVDYGVTWTSRTSSSPWRSVAMSSEGKYQTAVAGSGPTTNGAGNIHISKDYGRTWTAVGSVRHWRSVSMSSDGKFQTAAVFRGSIYVSYDYGNNWIIKSTTQNWNSVAISSDGKYQTATVENINPSDIGGGTTYPIFISDNYGDLWLPANSPNKNWRGVAMSSDGKYQTAVAYGEKLYRSIADEAIDGRLMVNGAEALLNGNSSLVVVTGNQTIGGIKTFSNQISVNNIRPILTGTPPVLNPLYIDVYSGILGNSFFSPSFSLDWNSGVLYSNNGAAGWKFTKPPTVNGTGFLLWSSVPLSGGASGTAGQIAYSGSYFYVCVNTNTWKRSILADW
jgi:hypothetical protein